MSVSDNYIAGNGQAGIDGEACSDGSEFLANDIEFHMTAGHAGLQVCGANNAARFNRSLVTSWGLTTSVSPAAWTPKTTGSAATKGRAAALTAIQSSAPVRSADPWLVLTIEASPDVIAPNGTSTITARLTMNSDAVDTRFRQRKDGRSVLFTTDLGTIGSSSVIKPMEDGTAEATHRPAGAWSGARDGRTYRRDRPCERAHQRRV